MLYNLITNKERFFIRWINQYNNFSEYYYGIGNETPDAGKTTVKYISIKSNQRVLMRVKGRHFIGFQYQYYKVSNTSFSAPPPPDPSGGNLGLAGFTTSGLGPVYLYDSRDNVINSSRGTYLEVSTLDANHIEGSQFDFINVTLDARKFFHLKNGQVFAVQGLFNHNSGDVPWRQMASMGGLSMMRGYYQGRHRDKNYAALQAEYRMHIWKFFGMTFFGSMGEVAPRITDLSLDQIKYAGGAGLRFQVDKKERVNIRFDVGFGSGTPGYYLTIGEAF